MLFALALIPVIGLLIFIYFKDKKEKEPFGFLIGLFFAGVSTITSAVIIESIGQALLGHFLPAKSATYMVILSLFVIGPAEELGKFIVLRLLTWHNRHFDYSYDAIVYAVFVSLGFAAIENIGYVFSNGFGTAVLRMFTAIPGHACFAVLMGFFYGRSKYAKLTKNSGKYIGFTILAMIIPIITHGIYDAIIMGPGASTNTVLAGFSFIVWLGYLIGLFTVSIILVISSSRHDFCVVTLPDKKTQTIYRPDVAGTWTCACGAPNNLNFCSQCGRPRPMINTSWFCPRCRTLCVYNFCGNCGCPRDHLSSMSSTT